jgi:hypothetical protein
MKNFVKWLGIISMALVIGFSFAACDDGSTGGGGGLNGVWKASNGEEITLNNGSFTVVSKDNKQYWRGKYTTSAKSITANITMAVKEIHGDILSEIDDTKTFENKWYDEKKVKETYLSLSDAKIADLLEILFPTFIGTIDGDTMTIDGNTYAKQSGGSGGGGGGNGENMTWTAVANSTFGEHDNILTIAYGGGKFVAGGESNAVGENSKMAYSSDGVSWTAVANTTFGTARIHAIAYGNNRFVAVGYNGKIAYSADGVSWTPVTTTAFNYQTNTGKTETAIIYAIAYGGNKFVAGGERGIIATSPDGVTWTKVANSTFNYVSSINAIAYGGGRFVAGGAPHVAYSPDGINWTAATYDNKGITFFDEIAYGNGKFVAGGGDGFMNIQYSADGATWKSLGEYPLDAIAFGNGMFVAIGMFYDGLSPIGYSADGVKWKSASYDSYSSARENVIASNAIAFGNGRFVVGGGNKMAYSTGK